MNISDKMAEGYRKSKEMYFHEECESDLLIFTVALVLFFTGISKVTPTGNLFTSEPDGCVKIRDSFEVNEEPITVPMLLQQLASDYGDYSALAYKKNEEWKMVNYR